MTSAQDRSTSARAQLPPGPRGQFFWGSLRDMRRDTIGLYETVARDYGDVATVRFAGVNTFALGHPDDFKRILQDNNRNYVRNPFMMSILRLFVGESLFTTDGDDWLWRRRLAQPAFHRQRIAGFGELMSQATQAMLERWALGPEGQRLEIDQEMMQLTLRIAGQALFSVDLIGAASELGVAFTEMSEFINYRMGHPFAAPTFIPTRPNRQYQHARRIVDRTIANMIRERRQSGEDKGDLLSMLMQARDEDTGETLNDQQLRNEIALMMFAGHETTAVTLTWAWHLLAQHPEAEHKLHAELDAVLGGRAPTIEDLRRLPYTRMVIEEALRLYPPAFGITRQAVKPDTLGGYVLPARSNVTLVIHNVQRDPRFWENPERFDPERFTPERSAGRHHFAYLPFGGGPRLCIGNQFALTEAQLVLATVAQRYQLRSVPGHPVKPFPIFVTRTSHGLPMTVHRR